MRLMTLPHIASGVVSLPICGARDVAQDFDGRSDTLNQKQMEKCAFADFERADRRLNAVYAKVRAAKRERDGELESQWRGTEKSLFEGERGSLLAIHDSVRRKNCATSPTAMTQFIIRPPKSAIQSATARIGPSDGPPCGRVRCQAHHGDLE